MKLSTRDLTLCALFAALVAVGAFIKVPVPFVPFTLQTFFVSLSGMILGARLGAVSVGVYIVVGLMGVPVFTGGGGIGYVLMPTFGYIIGFCIASYVTGKIVHNGKPITVKRLTIAGFVGLGIVYAIGVTYFYIIRTFYLGNPISIADLLFYCFLVTIPGDAVFTVVAAVVSKRVLPLMHGRSSSALGA